MLHYKNKCISNLDGEIWVDAYGYDGVYEVSNLGRIKSLERFVNNGRGSSRLVKSKILSQAKSKDNRLSVGFSLNNIVESINIPALIFQSFNRNKEYDTRKYCIMHIDKNSLNNKLNNLKIERISKSHKLNYKKGLLPHLDINHKKQTGIHFKLSHKTCKKCNVEKSIENFNTNRRVCKPCRNKQKKEYYLKNKGIDSVNRKQKTNKKQV